MRIVAISDTHTLHNQLTIPDGDVLLHAGDITGHGALENVQAFNEFLGTLPHPHKVVIAGNHDFCFERLPQQSRAALTNAHYLQDEEIVIDGVKFYGSPWQPWFFDWAFNLQRGPEIKEKWDLIPPDTDILITHGPPFMIQDRTVRGDHAGCEELIIATERIQPKLHVFGHIHEAAGISKNDHTLYVNACVVNLQYQVVNTPVVIDYPPDLKQY